MSNQRSLLTFCCCSCKSIISKGLSVAGAFVLLMLIGGFACFFVRRRKTQQARAVQAQTRDISTQPSSKTITEPYTNFFRSTPSSSSYSHSKSDLEKGSTYFGVQVFSYAELEEGTDNFDASRELGEGGFGTVYYGSAIILNLNPDHLSLFYVSFVSLKSNMLGSNAPPELFKIAIFTLNFKKKNYNFNSNLYDFSKFAPRLEFLALPTRKEARKKR